MLLTFLYYLLSQEDKGTIHCTALLETDIQLLETESA